jgi:N-acyl-D-aspartate/D-glutamate deacylase
MKALVREGMELGAVGLSTGLMYEPGLFSETEELVELAKEVKPYGGIFESHVRNPGHDLLGSDREVIEVARKAGVPGRIAHEKAVGLENRGLIDKVVKLVEAARAEGLDITTDQYPYDGAATARLEEIIVVPDEMKNAPGFDLRAALRGPSTRSRLRTSSEEGIDGGFAWLKATGYSHMRVTSAPGAPELLGRYLSELAEERGISGFDLVSDLIVGSEAPIGITLGAIAEDDVRTLLVQPWNMVASDGGYPEGDPSEGHPRSAGTFPRVLGLYVREAGLLTLEDAVRKMTSLPASNVGLSDRGRLKEGMAADVVVFDPDTVIDRSTWEDPHRFSEGVAHVLVNGEFVIRNGELTGATPGRWLRRDSSKKGGTQ